jgi:hypothetical protein
MESLPAAGGVVCAAAATDVAARIIEATEARTKRMQFLLNERTGARG